MNVLITEIQSALSNGLYLTSLNSTLLIPDICGALQSENGQSSGTRYKDWIDKFVSHKYRNNLTGEDVYKLRCASLHQGKFNHDYPKYEKILFQIPIHQGSVHNAIINNVLLLNLEFFCNDIIEGYFNWEQENTSNDNIERNGSKVVNHYNDGLPPYIVGVPILA